MPSPDPGPLQRGLHTWKNTLLTLILNSLKTRWGGRLLNFILNRASWLIPFRRTWESSSWLAFPHPRPIQPGHLLLLPKRPYRDLTAVPPQDSAFLSEMMTGLQTLIAAHREQWGGYRVIINGGEAQDINHLHIHLLGEDHG